MEIEEPRDLCGVLVVFCIVYISFFLSPPHPTPLALSSDIY